MRILLKTNAANCSLFTQTEKGRVLHVIYDSCALTNLLFLSEIVLHLLQNGDRIVTEYGRFHVFILR